MASIAYTTTASVNGTISPSPADNEELYNQLIRLRDVVINGKHNSLKLPTDAVERLKASLRVPEEHLQDVQVPSLNDVINGSAFATNQAQLSHPSTASNVPALPGLQTATLPQVNGTFQSLSEKRLSTAGLDPIFLQKSDSLVRAESQLKRQRLDRELQAQVEQRKHSSRDRDPGVEAPSPIDIDLVLLNALERVKPVSGLKEADRNGDDSSFDENDYYSSQVQSDWSSDARSSRASDRAAGAFTADFERLDGAASASTSFAPRPDDHPARSLPGISQPGPSKERPHVYTHEPEDVFELDEEDDDDYTPPDVTDIDGSREDTAVVRTGQRTPQVEDDNSDYEPGEISESNIPTPQQQVQEPAQPSPRVPIIRNHLTHIVAPQPNPVSPLATAKGASYERSPELELVNGRPEVVHRPQPQPRPQPNNTHTRASTASPSANGTSSRRKKEKKGKKRKRDAEPHGRNKRRREKQAAVQPQIPPAYDEPYVKDEPVSPPPFAQVPDIAPYRPSYASQGPVQIDLSSPGYAPQAQHMYDQSGSSLRYEYAQPTSPSFPGNGSPAPQQVVQPDTQDLRRVASLRYAQRPHSPQQRVYSPMAPYAASYRNHGEPHSTQPVQVQEMRMPMAYPQQVAQPAEPFARTVRSRSPPPQMQQYQERHISRAQSPATMMPPPTAPPRRIIVDQNGNKYYAAEAMPAHDNSAMSRASAAPVERRQPTEIPYERASTHVPSPYAHLTSQQTGQPIYSDHRMAPPPPPSRAQPHPEHRVVHVDANGYYAQDYTMRPVEPARYAEAPTSPIYQQVRAFEPAPSTAQYSAMPTSPAYAPTRSYSVRPEEPQQVLRHASVAPVQYIRRDTQAPMRAVSVMPGADYGGLVQQQQSQSQRTYSQAPQQGIRYVDQNGNEVFASQVRQVNEYR